MLPTNAAPRFQLTRFTNLGVPQAYLTGQNTRACDLKVIVVVIIVTAIATATATVRWPRRDIASL